VLIESRTGRDSQSEITKNFVDLKQINNVIHEPARLGILVLLLGHTPPGLQFNEVQNALGLSPGNLSSHTKRLASAEYITITKMFVDLKPRTWLKITSQGVLDLKNYASKLQTLKK